jgi:signal transduction histidine kinase
MRFFSFLVLAALWWARVAAAPAASVVIGSPFLQTFDRDVTTGSPVNWQVAVHPNGFVYAGNNLRLLEFDGVTWRGRKFSNTLSPETLTIDAKGRIWGSIGEEIDCFSADADGNWVKASRKESLAEADRKFGAFIGAVSVTNGTYFVAARQLVWFRTDDTVRVWRATTAFESIWTMGGVVYVTEKGRGFVRVEADGSLAQVAVAGEVPLILKGVAGKTADGSAILLTARGPMSWRGPGRPLVALSAATAARLAEEPAVAAVALTDGRFALGTVKSGLLILSASGEIQRQIDERHGLLSPRVNGLAEDAEGGLWLAQHNGLARVQVELPYERLSGEQGYRGSVRAVIRHGGRLYVGHADGVSRQDPVTGKLQALAGVPTNTNGTICFLAVGERLVASVSGVREITADGELRLVAETPANSLTASRRHAGAFFAATPGKGLWLFTPTPAGSWRAQGPVAAVPTRLVKLLDSGDGFVWGTTVGGAVWRADFRNGLRLDAPVETYGPTQGVPETTGSDYRQIFQLGGKVTVSNDKGLLCFDPAAQRFAPDSRIGGLPGPKFPNIVEPNGDGTYWAQCGNGGVLAGIAQFVHVVSQGPVNWRAEPWPEGPLNWVTVNSHFADPAFGKVWFATQSGVVAADATWTPGERPRPAWAPAIREVTTTQGRVVFTGTWSDGPERTWTENESAVRFSYAAPTYGVDHAGRPHARYRSRLDGLDADWGPWTTETLATYTNLPGRNFVFRVQARDILGNESREARFAFAIPPPWWRTWWFVGIAGISGVGSVAGVTRWLANRALRRRLQMLEARSAVERERLRLARDLHDEVGSGLGRVILFAGEARRYQADAVQLESALDRVRDTAQELVQHAREIVWAVSPQHDTLASVIERLGDYAEETLRAAGIACRVDAAGGADLPVVMLGSEARHSLFLALKEAVHNCVKYSGAKTAEFRLHVAEQHLVVTLCDHGRGFSPGEKQGTGHGLVNIAARAEAFHGEATVTSEVGKGTTVTLRVPLGGKPAAVS